MTAQNTGLVPLRAAILWQMTAQTKAQIKTANTYTGLTPVNLSILQIEFEVVNALVSIVFATEPQPICEFKHGSVVS